MTDPTTREPRRTTRRAFVVRLGGVSAAIGLVPLLEACAPAAPPAPAATTAPAPKPTTAPAATPTAAAPTAAAPTAAAKPTAASTTAPAAPKPTEAAKPTAAAAAQPTAVGAAGAAGTPQVGGTLRTTIGAEPTTLDPHKLGTLFDRDVADALFDALVDDDTLEGVKGALAESWDSADAKTWTFKLRQGVKFHDGSPFTAEVVKYNFDRLNDPATGTAGQIKPLVAQVASVTVVDPQTVRIDLKEPSGAFPVDLADIKLVPRTFDETKPVGTGAFQFVEWVRNQRVRVKKNPDFWMKGLPYLDEVVFMPTPDENQKVVLLQTGQVDFTDTIPLPRKKEVEGGGKIVVYAIPEGVAPSSYFVPFRTDRPPLNDKRVRQAISYAIDRQAQLDVTFGVGTLKSNVVPPKHWAFNPNAISYNQRNLARARQLLQEAGWKADTVVQFKYITSRAEYTPMAQLFQANLQEVGVKLELLPKELGVWVDEVLNKQDFQMGMTGIIPAFDPDSILVRYHTVLSTDGKAMAWKNDEYERLMAQGKATARQEDRKKIYDRVQEIVQDEMPGMVVNERPILYGATAAVQGFRPDIRQHTHFSTVWLKR